MLGGLMVKYVPVDSLIPYIRNPRTHTAEQVAKIAASIVEYGWTNPVLVDGDNGIIAGHGRLTAARKLGLTEVPVIELGHLSPTQKRAYVISDNRLALEAGWDDAMLALELAELSEAGYDLALTGFGDDEIERLLDDIANERGDAPAEADDDGADADQDDLEPPRIVTSRPGDIWLLGPHRIICADAADKDAVEKLMAGEPAHLLFTSPPYANQRNYTSGGIADWDGLMQGVFAAAMTALRTDGQMLVNLGLVHREGGVVAYWNDWLQWMPAHGWRHFAWYVWDQGPGLPGDWNGRLAPAFEFIFHFNRKESGEVRRANKIVPCAYAGRDTHLRGDGTSAGGMRNKDGSKTAWNHVGTVTQDNKIPDSVIRVMRHKGRIGLGLDHPAVFPVALPEFILQTYTDAGDTVFEPFCGSGTTLLAAARTGRIVRATEIAPEYVDVTVRRWLQHYPQVMPVLEATGQGWAEIEQLRAPEGVVAGDDDRRNHNRLGRRGTAANPDDPGRRIPKRRSSTENAGI